MKILSKTEDVLKKCYNVLVTKEELDAAMDAKLKEVSKKVRLDGFRPGKVPPEIVKRMYGEGIASESAEKAVGAAVKQVIKDEKLAILFDYSTNVVKNDENGLEFVLNLEVSPVFELKDFSDIEIKKYVWTVDEERVNKSLEKLQKEIKKWVEDEKTDTVGVGCKILIDLNITTFYGKKKKSEDVKDFDILMTERTVNDDLWKNLIGAKVSEVREFSVSYPLDFGEKAFAGKTVDYKANIKKILVSTEHALDDDFAKSLGRETFEDLKKGIADENTAYCERISRDIMRRDLLDKISDMYDFPVSEKMLQFEQKEVVRQIREEAQKLNKEFTPYIESECAKIAEKRVRLGFVIAEVAKKENVTVSKTEIANAIRAIARMHPGNERAVWDMYSRSETLPIVVGPILEGKVVEVLLSRIKVSEEVKCSFEELIAIDEEPFDFFKDEVTSEPQPAAIEASEAAPESAPETSEAPSDESESKKPKKKAKKSSDEGADEEKKPEEEKKEKKPAKSKKKKAE